MKEIASQLQQKSLIKSIGVFKFYSLMSGQARLFKPGIYELSRDMTLPQIVTVLNRGNHEDVKVVIPEGLSIRDIETILQERGVLAEGDNFEKVVLSDWFGTYPFLNNQISLEGFLFPDTYLFRINSSLDDILTKFFDNFEVKAWPLLENENKAYERLILASLLEKEVVDFNDRRLVAGIILKRRQNNWPLQIDATIAYAKCEGRFLGCEEILVRKSDLKIPSPYNTYEKLGFPPTPIGNPGQAAIKAALSPQSSPYWFYLSSTKTNQTIFSKTLEEHNNNRNKYL